MKGQNIIVVGASAGGVESLARLASALPADLPAALLVVLHMPTNATSVLPEILNRRGSLRASSAVEGEPIEHGRIYVAPPNHHLLAKPGFIRLVHGPRENGHRPAVDPLFRSAAHAYGARAIGVILSGTMDDGSLGLQIVKRLGGTAIVQDPEDALFPAMPQNAINNAEVDYVLPLDEIGPLVARLTKQLSTDDSENDSSHNGLLQASENLPRELGGGSLSHGDVLEQPKSALEIGTLEGKPSLFTCPDCGGVLMEHEEHGLLRYRCYTGHAYSADSLISSQTEALESALWTALRTLDEQAEMLRRLHQRADQRGHERAAAQFLRQAAETQNRAHVIREIIFTSEGITTAPEEIEARGEL